MVTTIVVIVILLVVIIAAVLIVAAMRPAEFRIERTATIKAPPARILPLINDFRNWVSWSPYEKLDPAMRKTLSGAPSGRGSVYEWEGNSKAGKGRMEIVESTPSLVAIDLHFMKPFKARNVAEFKLEPQGETTRVTWLMRGSHVFIGKVMGTFINMDRMIGRDFEAGLATLKTLAEAK